MSFSVVIDRYHQYNNQYQIIGDMTMTSTVNIQYSLFLHGNLILIIFYCLDNGYVFENHIGIVFRLFNYDKHAFSTVKKILLCLCFMLIYLTIKTLRVRSGCLNLRYLGPIEHVSMLESIFHHHFTSISIYA